MCKKCKALKNIWWSKQQYVYSHIRGRTPEIQINPRGAIVYERNSSWRALKLQTQKHSHYLRIK